MNLYREFSTQEEIDKNYNVELSVPDFGIYRDLYINGKRQGACRIKLSSRCSVWPHVRRDR